MNQSNVDALFQQIVERFQGGKLDEAETLVRHLLSVAPGHADAQHVSGLIAGMRGNHTLAADYIGRAIKINPYNPGYYLNRGLALCKGAYWDDALLTYDNAIQLMPQIPEFHYKRGAVLQELKRLDDAEHAYKAAISLRKSYGEAHYNLGSLYQSQGRHAEALHCFQQATTIKPDYAEAYNNAGNVLMSMSCLNDALSAFDHAIRCRPDYADAHSNRGMALMEMGRRAEALTAYNQAIERQPDFFAAHYNKGLLLLALGREKEALAACERAAQIQPDNADAFINLGLALNSLGKLAEGREACAHAITLDPTSFQALSNYANLLLAAGRLEESESSNRRALAIKPDYYQAHDNLLFALNHHPEISQETLYKAHCEWETQHAANLPVLDPLMPDGDRSRRLRVGYISPDFRLHSVAYFIEPLLTGHCRDEVEVFCYAKVSTPDAVTERLRGLSDHWHSIVGMTDTEAAAQIRADRIDILVELAGHTANNSLLVCARRPAPVQITWLGYPNTTGLEAIDYRFTDAIADPEGKSDCWHTEKLIRLEHGFLCYRGTVSAPPVSAPPIQNTGHLTFGSFNKLAKINPEVIKTWSELLNKLPGSRMLLKDKGFEEEQTRAHYLTQFESHGIGAEKLEFYGLIPDTKDHLDFYSRVDIGLDPFPYNGTTTTCEALWMGVPVVTLMGDRHAGRVGASILSHGGYEEWIASDKHNYVEIALALASDIEKLGTLRRKLRQRIQGSELCDSAGFAQQIEQTYRFLWKKACQKSL